MLRDLNYFPLDVESNIYGMTTLEFDDRTSKVLVANLDCQIYCIDYNKFKPHTKEVEFTYIPNGAKIISIGALKRGANDFVIGITHSLAPSLQKNAPAVGDYNKLTTYYFNIYAGGSVIPNFDLDYVAQGCQTIRLRYVPYHLYSTESLTIQTDAIGHNNQAIIKRKPIWLLSGGDSCIHAFCEDKPYQSFNEVQIEDCFPELVRVNSLVLWIDVVYIEGASSCQRAIALGLEDGSVKFYHSVLSTHSKNFELVRTSSFDDYTTIVPAVRFFKIKSTGPSQLSNALKNRGLLKGNSNSNLEQLNLLAISSTNSSLVFEDVLNNGLDLRRELPESERLDCATSVAIGDTNVDGLNEIIVGTHGRELLTYQYDLRSKCYNLKDVSLLNYPVFALSILDLTGDAMKDVAILLATGILIRQAPVEDATEICERRVDIILSLLH